MSALPICCSSCVCWLALTRELPAALTHTCCLARHCGSVLARAGPAFPQIRASPSRAEATMTANSLRICPLLSDGQATLCCSHSAELSAAGHRDRGQNPSTGLLPASCDHGHVPYPRE